MNDERIVPMEDLLAALDSQDRAVQRAAAKRLLARVKELASRVVKEPDRDLLNEAVSVVLERLVVQEPFPVRRVGDGYVARMIWHSYVTLARQRRPDCPLDAAEMMAHKRSLDGPRGDASTVREVFQALLDTALAAVSEPSHRVSLHDNAWQVYDLALGDDGLSIRELIDRELPDADPGERKKARNRLYKRHQRAREALEAAHATHQREGREHELECHLLRRLLRRQIRRRRRSKD